MPSSVRRLLCGGKGGAMTQDRSHQRGQSRLVERYSLALLGVTSTPVRQMARAIWSSHHRFATMRPTSAISALRLCLTLFALVILLPSAANAACTTMSVPGANTTPSTNPMVSGGTIAIDATSCQGVAGFGIGDITTPASHGTATITNHAASQISYSNNGDGATTDTFAFDDGTGTNNVTVTVHIAAKTSSITISPSTMPSGTVAVAYPIQTLSASGGTTPYTFSVSSGSPPPGLTLSGNTISGTPTTQGTYSFAITATDNASTTGTASYSISIGPASVNVTNTPADAVVNSPYSFTLTASGGTPPYTYTMDSGTTPPPGLSLTPDGTISGTPTATGTTNFTVRVTDSSLPSHFFSANNLSITVQNMPPPVANAVSATVAYDSTNNPITLSITGTPTSVAVGTQATHGTATASGTSITYTPTVGYAGPDSFTYTATNSVGTSSPATVTITVSPPTVTYTPANPPAGIVSVAYNQSIAGASGGTAPYTYARASGSYPPGVTLAANGTLSGTPTAAGTFNFTVRATDSSTGTGPFSSAPANVTVTINVQAPVANPLSATIGYGSTNNPITLDVTGGAPTSVAVGTQATHGTATASGTSIKYAPTAGYAGPDSFTYTATNAGGTSAPATVTITVSPPTITYTPANPPAGTVNVAYSQSIAGASGGTAPYTYTVASGTWPAGLTLTANGTLSGTPSAAGTFAFKVVAADSSTGTGPFSSAPADVTVTIKVQPPVANPANATVAYNSANNPITLDVAGGAPTSVAVGTQATHGTATASGTSITYTPASGYFGPDSFTYTATNASGTSVPATVTITVSPPAAPTTAAKSVTAPYNTVASIDLSGSITGVDISSVAVASAPSHGTATVSGETVAYTPSSTFYGGTDTFTYTATNPGGTSAPATVTITVGAPSAPAAAAKAVGTPYNTVASIDLSGSITGVDITSVVVASAPGHGTATVSGETVTYTPSSTFYGGTDTFTYTATNPGGTSAPATVTITVGVPSAPAAAAKAVMTPFNTAATIDLSGSITGVNVTSVAIGTPPAHGTASVSGETVTYTPSSTFYGGTDTFTYTATNPGGTSAPATVTVTVGAPPAPTVAAKSVTTPYNTPASIDLSGSITGVGVTSITVASAPSHGTTAVSGTTVTYTPAASFFGGSDSFTYTAANAGGTSAPATVTITVQARPPLVFAPAAGSLPGATAGSNYSTTIAASNGTAPYTYMVTAGSLPSGLTFNSSTGQISGVPTALSNASFTVTVTDQLGFSGTAAYTLKVSAPAIVAPSLGASATAGRTATVDLTSTATGGPFTGATLVSLSPSSAGTAVITLGDTADASGMVMASLMASGHYKLKFTPSATFSGTAVATYTLSNAYATSAPATVTFSVTALPDPTMDPDVAGVANAEVEATKRFAQMEIDNFNSHLEQLHHGGCLTNSWGINLSDNRQSTQEQREQDDLNQNPGQIPGLSEEGASQGGLSGGSTGKGRKNGHHQKTADHSNDACSPMRTALSPSGRRVRSISARPISPTTARISTSRPSASAPEWTTSSAIALLPASATIRASSAMMERAQMVLPTARRSMEASILQTASLSTG